MPDNKLYEYWRKAPSCLIPSSLSTVGDILPLTKKDNTILDIGCGNALSLLSLEKEGFTALHGIDINQESIHEFRKSYSDNNIHLTVSDATNNGIPSCTVDLALMTALLTVLVEDDTIASTFNETYRVLRPNGILFISDFFQNWHLNLYRNRYIDGELQIGIPGAFPVFGTDSSLAYIARHFDTKDIILALLSAGFHVNSLSFKDVVTRSGNKVIGFSIIATKPGT